MCLDDAPNVPNYSIPNKDKLVHFIFYFIFVFLWIKSKKNSTFNFTLIVLCSGLLLGVIIEVSQENFTKSRTFDWFDILANSIGAFASFFLTKKFYKIKN